MNIQDVKKAISQFDTVISAVCDQPPEGVNVMETVTQYNVLKQFLAKKLKDEE